MSVYYLQGQSNSGDSSGLTGYFYPLYLTAEEAAAVNPAFDTHTFVGLDGMVFYMPQTAYAHAASAAPSAESFQGETYMEWPSQYIAPQLITAVATYAPAQNNQVAIDALKNIESSRVEDLIPVQLRDSAGTLISLLTDYYKYLNSQDQASDIFKRIITEHEIDTTSLSYLDRIQSEIAKTVPDSRAIDRVSLYKRIVKYYSIRGSEESVLVFFRLFFDEFVQVLYPKDFLFKPSDGDWVETTELSLDAIIGYTALNTKFSLASLNEQIDFVSSNGIIATGQITAVEAMVSDDPNLRKWKFEVSVVDGLPINLTETILHAGGQWSINGLSGRLIDSFWSYDDDIIGTTTITNFIATYDTPGFRGTLNWGDGTSNLEFTSGNPVAHEFRYSFSSIGAYADRKGFASDINKLQDSNYWQDYSYVVKSGLQASDWVNEYLRLVHPAGMKLFAALLLQIARLNEWTGYETYREKNPQSDVSLPKWLKKLIPPSQRDDVSESGYHLPFYQPGWLSGDYRIISILIEKMVNGDDPRTGGGEFERSVFIILRWFMEANAKARNEIVLEQYQRSTKFFDNNTRTADYKYLTANELNNDEQLLVPQASADNRMIRKFSNLSIAINNLRVETLIQVSTRRNGEERNKIDYDQNLKFLDNTQIGAYYNTPLTVRPTEFSQLGAYVYRDPAQSIPNFQISEATIIPGSQSYSTVYVDPFGIAYNTPGGGTYLIP
jgi:hypothetical protein